MAPQTDSIFDSGTFKSKADAWLKSNNNLANAALSSAYRFTFNDQDDWFGEAKSEFGAVDVNGQNIGTLAEIRQAADQAQTAADQAQTAAARAQTTAARAQTAVSIAQSALHVAEATLEALQRGEGNVVDNLIDTRIRNLVDPRFRDVILVAQADEE